MSKIISIDLEFNKDNEILSAGMLQTKKGLLFSVDEFFFKNKVDKHTYKIHGLSEEFLSKNYSKEIKESDIANTVKENDFIVGFDLKNDFRALKINSNLMYGERKVIDIKHILSFFDVYGSLELISKKMNVFSKCKGMFPIHTSIMDSLLSYLIFEYLLIFISSQMKMNKEEILADLADISSCSYFSESWRYDHYYEKFFPLYRELKNMNATLVEKTISSKKLEVSFDSHIEVYDESFNIVSKIKKAKSKEVNRFFKPEMSLGYKD